MVLRNKRALAVLGALSLSLPGSLSAPVGGVVGWNAEQLKSRIESLRVSDHYWHKITWKKSVIEALIESNKTHKPIFMWAFIDMPDSERC